MHCPNCGCPIEVHDEEDARILQCACCETIWIGDDEGLDRILVGPEG